MVLAAFLITTVITIAGPVQSGWDWYTTRIQWREREYAKLRPLRAGFTVEKFEEVFGRSMGG